VTDRRTDRRTEFSSQYRVCITCSAVKINGSRAPWTRPSNNDTLPTTGIEVVKIVQIVGPGVIIRLELNVVSKPERNMIDMA